MGEVRVLWAEPARDLIGGLPPTLGGFWSAIHATLLASTWLGESDPRRWDTTCVEAAVDLGEALSELEWVDPTLPAGAPTVDLGPVTPLDDFDTCLALTAELMRDCVALAVRLLEHAGEARLEVDGLVAVSRAVTLLSRAHARLTGTLM
jgi:hypothetical protein